MTPNPFHFREKEGPLGWVFRQSRITRAAFLVFIAPLLLGMVLPGQNIHDPNGWAVGFWRYPVVLVIVLLQVGSFVAGWLLSTGDNLTLKIAHKALATVYIVLMSYWLCGDYFFGVQANWRRCIWAFVATFLPTVLMDGVAHTRRSMRHRVD